MSTMHRTASTEEWLVKRRELLALEKDLTRKTDELARRRRELPWVAVEKPYEFHSSEGVKTLAELFGDRSQLLVYHFMFGPDWEEGCPSCSFWADGFNGTLRHLARRDVALVVVSRAPLERLQAYRRRLGWTFPWVSSAASDFNFDFGVSATPEQQEGGGEYNYRQLPKLGEELPGLSAFALVDGVVYRTYSCFARGLEAFNPTYQLLDRAPRGRDEDGLPWPMAWVRRNDED